ncbi:hypothetical protein DLAC_10998 [Tieghemostelium lacteum]|uniref:Uncharacterized protein n=1 Tax=Tieghemostelium lacteum TaxID=361077 RepID=A0A151Z2W4_TIELA|nr:hypothetical protein DLAC_10998 [Tieghemostelium lacteum]|eukprot:KYQ88303.1 hypothetical protein DLAC_10998 [Tieghemostelium lacteum]
MSQEIIRVGCGAGYQGDRVPPAVTLVENGKLDYLILECLAERTLTDSIRRMKNGGKGYDTRLREWLTALLPSAQKNNVTIITNMGAADPYGAGVEAYSIARELGLEIRIVIVNEVTTNQHHHHQQKRGRGSGLFGALHGLHGFSASDTVADSENVDEDWEFGCTYLGADSIIDALKQGANLVIAGRVADPSLFVAPIAYRFGWDLKKDFDLIAQATLAGHLLECGCHLTGGYFAHPMGRNLEFESLSNLSLPWCDIDRKGNLILGKLQGSGGELSERTCKQQLTYEIGDPREYITPDVIVDFSKVEFLELDKNAVVARGAQGVFGRPKSLLRLVARNAGYKSWAEVSYGGLGCVERAQWAYRLVHKWMESRRSGIMNSVYAYLVGYNSLYLPHGSQFAYLPTSVPVDFNHILQATDEQSQIQIQQQFASGYPPEVRLRFDGLFELKDDALALSMELQGLALYGPAGGGGFLTGIKRDVRLVRQFIPRDQIKWSIHIFGNQFPYINNPKDSQTIQTLYNNFSNRFKEIPTKSKSLKRGNYNNSNNSSKNRVLIYNIAHSRSGDKGDTANVSLIPYDNRDFDRLMKVITKEWVYRVFKNLVKENVEISVYPLPGIQSLNIVLQYALDGGVCVSRRIDRHGKTLSDLILNQWIDLPPLSNL